MQSVLVVDENPHVREFITSVLSRAGHEADAVQDVATALGRIRAEAPDLLISDVVFVGDRGGLWLLEVVRAQFPDLPVLMMADEPDEWDDPLHTALSLGASDTLLKPLAEHRLRAAVSRLLSPVVGESQPLSAPA